MPIIMPDGSTFIDECSTETKGPTMPPTQPTAAAAVPSQKPPVLLIDLSAIFRAAWHANADGELSVAFQATLDGVRRCMGQVTDSIVAICCDGKGNWRKELSPEYKAQREKQPASMYDLLRRVKERLVADGLLLWECDGYEADDVIASATEAATVAGHHVTIASHDKDLMQLVCPAVSFMKTSTWETMGPQHVVDKFGVAPFQLGSLLALVGDKSDNIKGCEGCGEKTAAGMLTKFGTLANLFDSVNNAPVTEACWRNADGSPKTIRAKLKASEEAVWLAKKLIDLKDDAPIKFADIYEIREQKKLAEGDSNMDTQDADFDDAPISRPKPPANGTQTELPTTATPGPARASEPIATVQSTALVAVPAAFELALEPTHLSQAQKLSLVLHNSRLYPKLANDAQIFAVIVRGRELGLGALVALDVFSIVEGRLTPSAHFIIAKAKAHPDCEYLQCVDTTATAATWETKNRHNPKPTRLTYTIEQAKLAGRVDKEKGQWQRMPAEMLRKMAGVQLARVEYPEAALGLYADEEIDSQ